MEFRNLFIAIFLTRTRGVRGGAPITARPLAKLLEPIHDHDDRADALDLLIRYLCKTGDVTKRRGSPSGWMSYIGIRRLYGPAS